MCHVWADVEQAEACQLQQVLVGRKDKLPEVLVLVLSRQVQGPQTQVLQATAGSDGSVEPGRGLPGMPFSSRCVRRPRCGSTANMSA